jgi:phosphate transport system substrate-binding protein
LHDILTGRITRWTALHHAALTSRIVVGMCGINSGTYEYIKQRIVPDTAFAPVIERCSTSPDVISFVSEHPNAIGFVPVSWLKQYTDTITVLEVGDPNFKSDSTSTEMEYFSPEQAYMYKGYYPLTRPVYLFVHNADGGVETGFASFAAGVEGQRIIVKNGLVPATMPVRLVHLNNQ